jgi:serine/threonine protein kinase
MGATNKQEEAIFATALELADGGERQAYLDQACGQDGRLRTRVEKLIAIHEKAERFFKNCLPAPGAVTAPPPDSPAATSNSVAADSARPPEEQPGGWIGRYKLLEKIGEGGCGVVYMVEQEQPVRRRVALKVIKLGMDTKSVIARFEAERQALAMMDHPNIARVLDAGATDTGRPYFVMELVRGFKITEYCDQNNLDTRQRLDLFVQVCHALQHAHQKGIIHRDIKPSNILVTLHDGVPVPKVIDFGIAKAIEGRLTDKTLFTSFSQFIGTPAYMSPEQAEMSGLDIDTRSDLYSLGVLLYELLTDRTPFAPSALLESGLDEMRRTLRETEPPRPSAKLNTLHQTELTLTAQHRRMEAPRLVSQLRGDLDWIVMKALEKDRRRRYATANGLAMDIQRYLSNEPVLARPPGRLYRLQKLVRRNRGVFIASGAVLLTLLIGLGTSTRLFLREREAEQQQARLRREAESRESITHAALLVSQGRFDEAEKLAALIPFDQPSLEGALVLRSLGQWHALQGRWLRAADYFRRLQPINQLDGWDILTLDHLRYAAVLAQLGDAEGYENFRRNELAWFLNTTNPLVAERIIKASLLLPAGQNELGRLVVLARVTLPGSPGGIRNQFPPGGGGQGIVTGGGNAGIIEPIVGGVTDPHPDGPPPSGPVGQALASACSFDGRSLGVEFTEPVGAASATNPDNYTVSGSTVSRVTLGEDEKSVVLWLSAPLAGDFSIKVQNLRNAGGFPLDAGSISGTALNLELHDFATGQPCSVQYEGGAAWIKAGGENIWETNDHFVYVCTKITGDFDYRIRIHSIEPEAEKYARVGLMARDRLGTNASRMVMVGVNAENTFQVLMRMVTGGEASSQPPNPLPPANGVNSWVRLQRLGSVFHCYSGTNGVDWVELALFDSAAGPGGPFADPIYFGIATSSHNPAATVTAVISDWGVNPDVNVMLPSALLEYRLGNYHKAGEWSRRCLSCPEYDPTRIAAAHVLLAMSCWHLHQDDQALSNLLQGREMVEQHFQAGLDLGGGNQGFWFDWIAARILLQEATVLMDQPRPGQSNPK